MHVLQSRLPKCVYLLSSFVCKQIDDKEIVPGKRIKVNISVANVRLFVGNIPKQKSKEEIHEEFAKLAGEL